MCPHKEVNGVTEKKAKIIDLCKQIYLTALEGGDENSISLWATISSIVNASYNEGMQMDKKQQQQKMQRFKNHLYGYRKWLVDIVTRYSE